MFIRNSWQNYDDDDDDAMIIVQHKSFIVSYENMHTLLNAFPN